jgi:hypothetical protein
MNATFMASSRRAPTAPSQPVRPCARRSLLDSMTMGIYFVTFCERSGVEHASVDGRVMLGDDLRIKAPGAPALPVA